MVSPKASQDIQRDFAAHLRQPDEYLSPQGIEDRRMKIYRDLIYNNIESFIANGFPILRKIYSDHDWHEMVRDFVARHQSKSPYFLDIASEFIGYLEHERKSLVCDPPFLFELANYEWAELALYVSDEQLPENNRDVDPELLEAVPVLSPLAWSMVFQYPVHKIGVDYQPTEADLQPVCLVVYRNRKDSVKFLESNPVTARLLELCENNKTRSSRQLLEQVATELGHASPEQVLSGGEAILAKLRNLDIIFF